MAIIHTQGTILEEVSHPSPITKYMLWGLAGIFIVAMHFFQPNPGGAGLLLSFNAATWLATGIVISIGLYQMANSYHVRFSRLTIGLMIACLLLTLPILYPSADVTMASERLIGLWAGWLLLLLLQQFHFNTEQKLQILLLIVIAVLIESLLGLVQYLLLQPGNPMGYNTVINRPYGIFQQPNVMASFLTTGLALSGYLLVHYNPRSRQGNMALNNLLFSVPLVTIPLLIVLASRTGWIATLCVLILITPYIHLHLSQKKRNIWLLMVVLGFSFGAGLSQLSSNEEGLTTVAQRANLSSPRAYTFPQALDMVIEKPISGYGYGRFEPEYIIYTARQHQLNPNYPAGLNSMDHPHNETLYWAVEGGIVPILGLVLAALLVLRKVIQAPQGTRLALAALFFPLALHSQLEYPFYHSAAHWLIFVILIYWVDQTSSQYYKIDFNQRTKSLLRVSSLVIPLVTSFFMLTALHSNAVLTRFEKTKPVNLDILNQVTNPSVWKDRFDWDVYSTQLNIGLALDKVEYIQPYIDWSNQIIKRKPRPLFYSNLILAYQGLGAMDKAEQVRNEAQFLFPDIDFSKVTYIKPPQGVSQAVSHTDAQ